MEYRKEKGLPAIALSKSLTIVAQMHVRDLEINEPHKEASNCNMHSWSDVGEKWSGCCYTSDHKAAKCMWDKPRELTKYKGDGFEIAHGYLSGDSKATAAGGLAGWKGSPGHNAVMINLGIWKKVKWQAVGIGIYEKYAVIWFGKEKDKAGIPGKCK
ncbi:MAG: CAP domain-containing protein [Lentisphaeria bacterium]|nr:CAP domain-containing protein [Lentisphaeria bacterium]NQZ66925.1 CAP domain-containing protein [Lentisphaeria bacterium]